MFHWPRSSPRSSCPCLRSWPEKARILSFFALLSALAGCIPTDPIYGVSSRGRKTVSLKTTSIALVRAGSRNTETTSFSSVGLIVTYWLLSQYGRNSRLSSHWLDIAHREHHCSYQHIRFRSGPLLMHTSARHKSSQNCSHNGRAPRKTTSVRESLARCTDCAPCAAGHV